MANFISTYLKEDFNNSSYTSITFTSDSTCTSYTRWKSEDPNRFGEGIECYTNGSSAYFYSTETIYAPESCYELFSFSIYNPEYYRYDSYLTYLNLSNFDTSNVTDMERMFYGCNALTSLDVSNFDTLNVANMTSMFHMCNCLKNIIIDTNKWTTYNVTSSSGMFYECSNLPNFDSNYIDKTKAYHGEGGYLSIWKPTKLMIGNIDISSFTQHIGQNDISKIYLGNFMIYNKDVYLLDSSSAKLIDIDNNYLLAQQGE